VKVCCIVLHFIWANSYKALFFRRLHDKSKEWLNMVSWSPSH